MPSLPLVAATHPRPVVVWPSPTVLGWTGAREQAPPPPAWPRLDLGAALSAAWPTDAHAVGYVVPGEPTQPRVRRGALRALVQAGAEPLLTTGWLDLDRPMHAPWSDEAPARRAVRVLGMLFPRAVVYSTRSGARLVWLLDEPIPVSSANAWLRGLVAWADPIARRAGLVVDATSAQWTRCFRLPHTVRPGGSGPVILDAEALHGPPFETAGITPVGLADDVPSTGVVPADLPDTYRMGARPGTREGPPVPEVPAWHLASLRRSPEGERVYQAHANGTPLAAPGDRDNALLRAVGTVVAALGHEATPAAVYAVVLPTVEAMRAPGAPDPDGAPRPGKLWAKCLEICARDYARRAAANGGPPTDPPPPPPGTPTPADLAAAEGIGPAIVLAGGRYYVRRAEANTYAPGVSAVGLGAALRDHQPTLPRYRNGTTLHPAPYLLDRFGVEAGSVEARYGHPAVTYDPDTTALTLPGATLRPVEPRYDPQIDAWLALLGGEHADRLLNWLATVHRLDTPTAALYLQGGPGGGKTLLAASVAALWGTAPIPFERATARFNDALLASPVVALSEGLSWTGDGRKRAATAAFRSLLADGRHTVEIKHGASLTLHGHPRLLIGANNAEALPIGTATSDDLRAIYERILHIPVPDEAGAYVRSLDPETVATWPTPGGPFAAHAAHLRATRPAPTSGRYLVAGVPTDYHRGLQLRSGINTAVLQAVGEALAPSSGRPHTAVAHVAPLDEGATQLAAWVNVAGLHGAWTRLVQEDGHRPLRSAVLDAVRDLAIGPSRSRRDPGTRGASSPVRSYWPLPVDLVERVATDHGVPTAEALRATLRGETPPPTHATPQGPQT